MNDRSRTSPEGRKWPAYNGDRILVAKFPYDFAEPKRWDVVVFRFPGNGQMNFIKRLVGLPRETVKIDQGDIFVKPADDEQFAIIHKPAAKVWAMAQAVYNNDYVVDAMTAAGWPLRWQPMGRRADGWASPDGGRSYEIAGGDGENWIRYQHFTPNDRDWREMESRGHVTRPPLPHLITDFYAYNTGEQRRGLHEGDPVGLHWVGDLMLEATLDVRKDQGSVVLDLVKGGRHFQCTSGRPDRPGDAGDRWAGRFCTHGSNGRSRRGPLSGGLGQCRSPTAAVDRRAFGPSFPPPRRMTISTTALPTVDDLAPAGIAAHGADVKAEHLLLKRDVYYIAANAAENGDYDFPGVDTGERKSLPISSPCPTAGRPTVCSRGGGVPSFRWRPTSFSCWGTTARRARIAGCGPTATTRSITCGANC